MTTHDDAARGGTAAAGDEGLRAVRSLHRKTPILPDIGDCPDPENHEHGDADDGTPDCCWDCPPVGWTCSSCWDEYGEDAIWPCATIRALDATPAPTEDPAPSQDTLRAAVEAEVANWRRMRQAMSPSDWLAVERVLDGFAALAATTPEATGRDGGAA